MISLSYYDVIMTRRLGHTCVINHQVPRMNDNLLNNYADSMLLKFAN